MAAVHANQQQTEQEANNSSDELVGIELVSFCCQSRATRSESDLQPRVLVVNITHDDIKSKSLKFLEALSLIPIPNEEGILHFRLPRGHHEPVTMESESEAISPMRNGVSGNSQEENVAQDGLDAAEDADLFGDGSDADADADGYSKSTR